MIKKLFTLSAVKAAILLLLVFSYQQVSSAQTISIGTVRIDATKDNADVLGNGTVSYEAANLLLKLKGASIEGSIVINGVKGLTLQVEGDNSVVSTKAALEVTNNSQVTVTGDRLSLTSSKNSAAMVDMQCKLTLKEVSVVATGSFAALAGSTGFMGEVLEIDNTNLTAQGTAYAIGDLQIFSAALPSNNQLFTLYFSLLGVKVKSITEPSLTGVLLEYVSFPTLAEIVPSVAWMIITL